MDLGIIQVKNFLDPFIFQEVIKFLSNVDIDIKKERNTKINTDIYNDPFLLNVSTP